MSISDTQRKKQLRAKEVEASSERHYADFAKEKGGNEEKAILFLKCFNFVTCMHQQLN